MIIFPLVSNARTCFFADNVCMFSVCIFCLLIPQLKTFVSNRILSEAMKCVLTNERHNSLMF